MSEQKKQMSPHSLILENRSVLTLTGVTDVAGFDELTVNVFTDYGQLIIKGSSLHISRLSLETGEVTVDGSISSLQYTASQQKGILSKLFK
ncbi:MAG: sporulation protein YabP [Acutalibacteraceae bacterium]